MAREEKNYLIGIFNFIQPRSWIKADIPQCVAGSVMHTGIKTESNGVLLRD